MTTTTMTYGSYSFSPVPMMTINESPIRDGEGRVGTSYRISLTGKLSTKPLMDGGIANVDTLQDELRAALEVDGNRFQVSCNGVPLLICYPKVKPLEFSPTTDNWVYTSNYSVELSFEDYHGDDNSPYVNNVKENWEVSFIQPEYHNENLSSVSPQHTGEGWTYPVTDKNPYFLNVSHSLSAVGIEHYESGTGVSGARNQEAWEYARDWVMGRLGFDSGVVQESGILNLDISNYGIYNHMRSSQRSETEGSYSCNETWLVSISGSGAVLGALEDFSLEVIQSESTDITEVSINGTIQGLENRTYGSSPSGFSITTTKINAAENYWNTIKTRLLPRAQYYSSGDSTRNLNVIPLVQTVGKSPTKGFINYSYKFDDRPSNCISGAKTESITISDNNANDIFASIPIPGRLAGPIHQSMGTISEYSRNISVSCVMPPSTGCGATGLFTTNPRSQVAALICSFQTELTNGYNQVFKKSDNETWEPKKGIYSRNVLYVYQNCSGSGNTSLC